MKPTSAFLLSRLAPIRWEDTQALLSEPLLDEIAAFENPGEKALSRLQSSWKTFSFKEGALVEMKAPFRGSDFTYTLTGYFLRRDADILNIIPIYNVSDDGYYEFPRPLLTGEILKNYRQVILFGSTGMGDCGRFLIETQDGNVFQVPVRCTAVGC